MAVLHKAIELLMGEVCQWGRVLIYSVIDFTWKSMDDHKTGGRRGKKSLCKWLTHKQLEMHECIISTVATDVLVPRHQAISSYSADSLLIVKKTYLL